MDLYLTFEFVAAMIFVIMVVALAIGSIVRFIRSRHDR